MTLFLNPTGELDSLLGFLRSPFSFNWRIILNTILLSLIAFVVFYITAATFKYAAGFVLTASLVTTGSTLANHYGGQSAMLLMLVLSPVIYVAVSDLLERFKSVKRVYISVTSPIIEQHHSATGLVETTLTGEWISGKTPEITFQQPLIGDVKALPRPWL